jgi:hypothetical protein
MGIKSSDDKSITLLGQKITPEIVQQTIMKASAVKWGAHLVRWRYFDVEHDNQIYRQNVLLPTDLWHLLKRIYVDEEWPIDTTQEKLNADAQAVLNDPETEIFVYGYYRTYPPRIQWGFLNKASSIAVVYDAEADLVATVFKPSESQLFFERQLESVKVDRKAWNV